MNKGNIDAHQDYALGSYRCTEKQTAPDSCVTRKSVATNKEKEVVIEKHCNVTALGTIHNTQE